MRLLLLGLFISSISFAQKNDYIWLGGYESATGYDSITGSNLGTTEINFNFNPIHISYDTLAMNFSATNTTFSDSAGDLLFYTNGIYVANKWHEKIDGSDSLNDGYITQFLNPAAHDDGYFNAQGIIALPIPGTTNEFALMHACEDTFASNIICKRLLYTHLNMAMNAGHGKVLSKNEIIINSYIGNEVVAVKHANGRDWWLLTQKRGSNCFYRTLVDSSGPHLLPDLTCAGIDVPYNDDGAAQFSPDGSKFAYFQIVSGVTIFDFNRCNGELSNPLHFSIPTIADSGWYPIGCSFSPNSRFLYLSAVFQLYQFDLTDMNMFSQIDTVAQFGFNETGALFCGQQLGPDGKIYISSSSGYTRYSVIADPDVKGMGCNVMRDSLHLKSFCISVPNYPNYRLAALSPEQCETNGFPALNDKMESLMIYPNPAENIMVVDYGKWISGINDFATLKIVNALGEVVYVQELRKYATFEEVNVAHLSRGVYQILLESNAQYLGGARLFKL